MLHKTYPTYILIINNRVDNRQHRERKIKTNTHGVKQDGHTKEKTGILKILTKAAQKTHSYRISHNPCPILLRNHKNPSVKV